MPRKRRICFVTGTRAEFGLMESTLRAIRNHPKLKLQIVVTGMHLDRRHGNTIRSIERKIDATVPWRAREAEQVLKGQVLDVALAEKAAAVAFEGARVRAHNAFKVGTGKQTLVRALMETRAMEIQP